ncbi:hypothetical protein ALC60_12099 [Trachymyrmex zeteki]|uniref:Uncharacterized protein n=1 Tax=Mycetomoellerius zeteki TaxID=64791 RepID=A0A151WMC2_9HYME|nr:hypothetical protein ALC60_12099 [Trachymyrmex zeteki]
MRHLIIGGVTSQIIATPNIGRLFVLHSFQFWTLCDPMSESTTITASAKNGGTFCFASINKCLRSSSTDSSFALLMKVVAIPVRPERPVRPILCTKNYKITLNANDSETGTPPIAKQQRISGQSVCFKLLGPSFLMNGISISCSRQNSMIGKTNTNVLPLPVEAIPIMSRPDNLQVFNCIICIIH